MINKHFKAICVSVKDKRVFTKIKNLPFAILPKEDVTVKVTHSGLNCKENFIFSGVTNFCDYYPIIPGSDLVGVVENDNSATFNKGQRVFSFGSDLGEKTFGCFSEYIRVKPNILHKIPDEISSLMMAYFGTAGLIANSAVKKLKEYIKPNKNFGKGKNLLVTGASSPMGMIAISLLSKYNFCIYASSSQSNDEKNVKILKSIGAKHVIDRITNLNKNQYDKYNWDVVIDFFGGKVLETSLLNINKNAVIITCAIARDSDLKVNMKKLIKNEAEIKGICGLSSVGIDKEFPFKEFNNLWEKHFKKGFTHLVSLEEVLNKKERYVAGKRIILDLINKNN